ncbi:MAG: hypothetical protein B6I36_07860 [Desulfobacteraceae bacterium 4572_35.1]|nr:MAG: hypothetical protein B6I36_07860 [Desulfobacteraceae bacterium 4572_35.1]
MKRVLVALALTLAMAAPAFAVDFAFHGDFNHRFRLYTNHVNFFDGAGNSYNSTTKLVVDPATGLKTKKGAAAIGKDDSNDTMGELKYRMWMTASSDDGAIKGTYAIEVGGIQFGNSGRGGAFSGDGTFVETRWAFTDFALAGGRTRMGLMPINVNKFLWNETVTGIDYKVNVGNGDLTFAWYRGYEVINTDDNNDFKDLDALYLRYNLKPAEGTKVGFFALWQTSDGATDGDLVKVPASSLQLTDGTFLNKAATTKAVALPAANYAKTFGGYDLDLYTLGVDGSLKAGNFFANWDLMYQFGDMMEEYDFGGYFIHVDAGMKMGKGKLTGTFWYASGDDDSTDGDLDAFVATDVDINSQYSVVLFEGYTDDDYFSETPYLMDKGLMLTRIGYDFQVSDKLKVGVAALYLMTAEDIEYIDDNGKKQSDDSIGFEFDAYASYKLFSKTEAAIQFGYLMADDAMDYYEVECDGDSDEDIFIISSRIRYHF